MLIYTLIQNFVLDPKKNTEISHQTTRNLVKPNKWICSSNSYCCEVTWKPPRGLQKCEVLTKSITTLIISWKASKFGKAVLYSPKSSSLPKREPMFGVGLLNIFRSSGWTLPQVRGSEVLSNKLSNTDHGKLIIWQNGFIYIALENSWLRSFWVVIVLPRGIRLLRMRSLLLPSMAEG